MRVERASTGLADAGYTLLADTVVPYEEQELRGRQDF
jgi:hypothetical protein